MVEKPLTEIHISGGLAAPPPSNTEKVNGSRVSVGQDLQKSLSNLSALFISLFICWKRGRERESERSHIKSQLHLNIVQY